MAIDDSDWIFCGANCYAVPSNSTRASILDYVPDLFPAITDVSTYIPAFTGHAVNQRECRKMDEIGKRLILAWHRLLGARDLPGHACMGEDADLSGERQGLGPDV